MGPIMEISTKHQLKVVEDNAQGIGTTFNQKKVGSFGHANACSFYPTKNLGAIGDAGAVTTDDEDIFERIKLLRNYGSQKKYINPVIGYNNRIDALQARFLSIKLRYLEKWNLERAQLAKHYNECLDGIGDIVIPLIASHATSNFHLYVIRTNHRDSLQNYLEQHGIGTIIHYPIPPHLQQCYQYLGFQTGDFPIAERIANTALSLPLYIGMNPLQVEEVCNCISNFFKEK